MKNPIKWLAESLKTAEYMEIEKLRKQTIVQARELARQEQQIQKTMRSKHHDVTWELETLRSEVAKLNISLSQCIELGAKTSAENEKLKAGLKEAMEWNWLDEESPPPKTVLARLEWLL